MDIWEKYDLAFHYTTQAGLLGILESQTLYATHFAYLNDSNEMKQIKQRVCQIALLIVTKMYHDRAKALRNEMDVFGGPDKIAAEVTQRIIDGLYKVTLGEAGTKFYQPFIASFCAHKEPHEREDGLLSQWRGYGKESGYAIVFDVKKLIELLRPESERFQYDSSSIITDVAYDVDEQTFEKEFAELIKAMHEDIPKVMRGDEVPYTALNNAFLNAIPRYKHRGFAEEKEIRIVAVPTQQTMLNDMIAAGKKPHERLIKKVKFRGEIVPYIVLFEDLKDRLPIIEIIVGPHADKAARAQRLRKFLELREMSIKVRCSEIPFIG